MIWTEMGRKWPVLGSDRPFSLFGPGAIPLIIVSRTVGALALSPHSSGIVRNKTAAFDQERGAWTLCAPDCAEPCLLSVEVSAKSLTLAANETQIPNVRNFYLQ